MTGKADFTAEAVRSWLQLKVSEPGTILPRLVEVVAELVDATPGAPLTDTGDWTARTVQAAIMQTARLYRRRNSPGGVEALTEGGATYVARFDPDIERMLRTGRYLKPVAR